MARTKNRAETSRKQYQILPSVKFYRLGCYVRLSEGSEQTGSNSLQNQKSLLGEYINSHPDLELYSFYEDDGFTGTDFNRTAFERMMNDVRDGIIDCIIVKDLSRFGREHLVVGDYIEKVFPFLGVRFISVMDHYDSLRSDCSREKLILSLKSLMHELYSKDLSKRASSSIKLKLERGECFGKANVIYGLTVKDGEKLPSLDYRAAIIVRKIAGWFLGGASIQVIIIKLHNRKILPPTQYRKTGKICGDKDTPADFWARRTIKSILENIEYTGVRVTHKTEESLYHNLPKYTIPKEERIKLEGISPVILRKDIFDRIQIELERRKEKFTNVKDDSVELWESYSENIFSGIFVCGDCGASMGRKSKRIRVEGKEYKKKVFYCRSHMNTTKNCDKKSITERELCEILVKVFQTQLLQVRELEIRLTAICNGSVERKITVMKKERRSIEQSYSQIETSQFQNYMKYQEQALTQEQFISNREEYERGKELLRHQKSQIEKRENSLKRIEKRLLHLVKALFIFENDLFQSHEEEYKRLTKDMIQVFTKKILLYQDRRVKIVLRFEDEIKGLLSQLEEQEERRVIL